MYERSSRDYTYERVNFAEDKTKATVLGLSLGYTFTDNLSIMADGAYYIDKKQEIKTVSSSNKETYESDGFTDPTLTLGFHALDQASGPFNCDLLFSYSPKTMNRKEPTFSKKGNVARGGHDFGAEIQADKKLNGLEIMAGASFLDKGDRRYKDSNRDWDTANSIFKEEGGHELNTTV